MEGQNLGMCAMTTPAAILSALNAAVLTVDRQGTVTSFNPAAESLLNVGATQALGNGLAGLLSPDHPLLGMIETVRERAASLTEYEVSIETPRVALPAAIAQLSPLGDAAGNVAVMLAPVTLAREIDRHLAHRGAARSMGGMAAVLAHEIKNPLAGIRGAAQLIEANVGESDRELTALIRDEADRVAALVTRMEAFAGPEGLERKPVNIHEVLNRVRKVAEAGFAARLAIRERYDPSLPPVPGDHDRLVQLFLNLVRNAADACPESGGEIRLQTVFRHGERLAVAGSGARAPLPLEVSVQDNGAGVPEEMQRALFEPFVTGRPNGQGLGLALVARIVDEHGGAIAFESEPGRTLFRVLLPIETGGRRAR